jgi:long-subunit acyl-CoA synthetase (AMP-forming)
MTEATLMISANADGAARGGSVGRLLPNVEAKVVDAATGAELPAGGAGELLVRGPNVMRGYLRRPELRPLLRDRERERAGAPAVEAGARARNA